MRVLVALLAVSGCVGLEPITDQKSTGDDSATTGLSSDSFAVDRGAIDFGVLPLGDEASEALAVTNTAEDLLRLTAAVDGPGVFSLTESSLALAPGEEAVLTVTFSPDSAENYDGTLTLADADGASIPVTLSGAGEGAPTDPTDPDPTETGDPTAGAPDVAVDPTTYDFGTVDVAAATTKTFTVRNDGDVELLISDFQASPSQFVATTTMALPAVLRPGGSGSVTVTFTPPAETTYTGALRILTDDPDEPTLSVALSGTGADLCSICSGLISVDTGSDPYAITDFLSVLGLEDTRTVSVQNVGDMDLEVSDVYVNNDSLSTCGTFSLSGWSRARTLSPYDSLSFDISYTATSVCADLPLASLDQNVVHIISDDPSQGDYVIELSGIGLNF